MKLKEILNKIKFKEYDFEDEYLDDEIDASLDEEMSTNDKKFFKRINKKIVAAMVAAAVLISAITGVSGVRYMMAQAKENEDLASTVPVTKQDIQKTLSATGTIISAEESGQFATAAGSYPVEEVYVKVGDVVKKGDKLYKLDMSTMEETLSYQQEALNIQNQQNAISTENANRALEEAKGSGAIKVNEANQALAEAKQAQAAANRDKDNSSSSLNDKKSQEDNAKNALDSANQEVSKAKAALDDANSKLDSSLISDLNKKVDELTQQKNDKLSEDAAADVSDINSQIENIKEEISSLQENVENAKKAYDNAVASANSKKSEYDSAVADRKSAESALQSANDALTKANSSVNSAASNVGNVQNSANQEIINQSQAIKNNDLSTQSNTLSAKQEISKSKEELSKAVVYASQDGTVTNVNVVKGQTYSGTDAVVIDNVTSLKATADIDEAQISSIAIGQKVQIKTDATGDEILEGTVSFVSPTATKNSTKTTDSSSTTASVSKSRASYRVDVTLDNVNEKLRLGMTAKMTFITESVKDALVVPSSDIQTDADGNKYVIVQKADGSTSNVTVNPGISDDFYTEIKDSSLTEQDTIVENLADGSADSVINDMGADGGIYFE